MEEIVELVKETAMQLPRSFLIIVSFISGGVVGYFAANWSKKRHESEDVARSAAAAIVRDSHVLNFIQNGKTTNAVMLLRSGITVHTMILEACLRELPPNRRQTNLVKILEKVKE